MKRAYLLVLLILAFLLTRHYGESWDELQLYKYAGHSLAAYFSWPRTGTIPFTGDLFENYGPAFVMFSALVADALAPLGLWPAVDIHHLLYFLTFLLGVWAFHQLCKRWMTDLATLGATLLFASQPLLWGHAFINPKDTTLLAMMLLSVYLGLKMHASLFGPFAGSRFDALTSAWAASAKPARRWLVAASLLWLASLLILFGGTPLLHAWLDSSVRAAASGEPSIISRFASDIHKVAPEIYIQKFFVAFLQARAVFFWTSTLALLLLFWRKLPSIFRVLGIILPAAIALGLTSSIRIFGPLAGILVTQHAIRNTGKKSLPILAIYAIISILVMYATWPYLWSDPIGHLIETATIMSHHPWTGLVLFNGVEYQSTQLPAAYMPTLLAIQLTEPVWVLASLGLAVAALKSRKTREGRDLLALALVWFILPLVTFVILRPTMYDNFRQAFFILPMVFVLAGIAFDQVRRPLVQVILILAMLAPGVVGIVRLHPYEYAYYNSFAGGAFRKFEMDYWGTSYREIALELNRIAPPNADVWVEGPAHLIETYARPDLRIYSYYEPARAEHYDYVVTLSRDNLDLTIYPDAPIIFSVTRDGAALAVIKKP